MSICQCRAMPDMMPTSLAAPRTGKFVKNIFERGENLLHNDSYITLCV